MRYLQTSVLCALALYTLASLVSCRKDTDGINWSPTQPLPSDTIEDPIDTVDTTDTTDTTGTLGFPFLWEAILIGDENFYGDSLSAQYVFDTLASMHEFSCIDQMGRQMIIRMPDLEIGNETISFTNSASITLIDDTLVFDTNFNPNGYINIYSNSNGRISAFFASNLNDIAGSGQEQEMVNGHLQNVRYE